MHWNKRAVEEIASPRSEMIVTIDGPAGAGKSTAARRLAERLGYRFLDTGAMYRAVAWHFRGKNVELDDAAAVARSLSDLLLEMRGERVTMRGRDVTRAIRAPELAQLASQVATRAPVREHLVRLQRSIAAEGDIVCEGRDQGTVVFPDAGCKFFLTADPLVRAKRRWLELVDGEPDLELNQVVAEQKIRDLRDETREVGRLVRAPDSIEIRVDDLTLDELVDELERHVRNACRGA